MFSLRLQYDPDGIHFQFEKTETIDPRDTTEYVDVTSVGPLYAGLTPVAPIRTTSPGLTVYRGGAFTPRYIYMRQRLGGLKVDRHLMLLGFSYWSFRPERIALWPLSWDERKVALVLAQIDAMHNTQAPLEPFAQSHPTFGAFWQIVASNPAPFLSLNFADERWLGEFSWEGQL